MDKLVVTSISKNNIQILPKVIEYCEQYQIKQLVILLFGEIYGKDSIVEKDGLRQLVSSLPLNPSIDIHIIREGLGYNLSPNDYKEVFKNTSYKVETQYKYQWNQYQLIFTSNNIEDCMWDDQYFMTLQKQASSDSSIKITAVYKPVENDYLSQWGKSAWKLSQNMSSTLIYLDDGDIIEFDDLNVYKLLYNHQITKEKIKEYKEKAE